MKIAIFSDTFSPQINGVTNTLGKLVRYFQERNIEYKIFVPKYENEDIDSHTERYFSLKFFIYPECRIALPNIFRVSNVLSNFQPDLIHIMTEFNMGLTGLYYARKFNIPTISNYTTNFAQYTDYYKLDFLKQPIWDYMKWFHNQNSITLCPSKETQKVLGANGVYHTGIFSRGVDTLNFSPAFRNENLRKKLGLENKSAILYVGRVSVEKDLDVLNESYREIKKKYNDQVALIITGEGPYLEKSTKIFPKDTIFTGLKKGKELAEIYASSDVFVCPSSTETFGNVVLEAMASGLAVIGADAGGIKEIINHRSNGLKFPARDAAALTGCLNELMENVPLKQRLGISGREFALTRSWDKIFGGLMDSYQELLSESRTISA